MEEYDIIISPNTIHNITNRDTLKNPPKYINKWIITNPPYLARNKNQDKSYYDLYNTNDLYKCFIKSICDKNNLCNGGIIIIPSSFFFSRRKNDYEIRNLFFTSYQMETVNYFEEQVFNDTTTCVVSILFKKKESFSNKQTIKWRFFPNKIEKILEFTQENKWMIGEEVYNLPSKYAIKRYISSIEHNYYLSNIILFALDSGNSKANIRLEYLEIHKKYKHSDRSEARILLPIELSENQQKKLCKLFNDFLNEKRKQTNSLFLPSFREFSRKRISFELAYIIIGYFLEFV